MEVIPTNLNTLLIIIFFIIPGFIINKIISIFHPYFEVKKRWGELTVQAITFSCINYALFSWLILWLLKYLQSLKIQLLLAISVLIVGPFLIGLLFSFIIEKFLRSKLTSTAWDDYFSRKEPAWILITLKDGEQIGGFFSSKSAASPNKSDIYIQEIWKVDQNGKFLKRVEDSKGALLDVSQIKYIKFFEIKSKKKGVQNG